jgi:CBS domain-containing protein
MTIHALCNKNIITATATMTITKAISLMNDNHIGALIIIDDERGTMPIGLITDRDIALKACKEGTNLNDIQINDIMTKDLVILKDDQGIKETLDIMSEKGIRRAPVVNHNNELIGIISLDDLTLLLAEEIQSISKLIRNQMVH